MERIGNQKYPNIVMLAQRQQISVFSCLVNSGSSVQLINTRQHCYYDDELFLNVSALGILFSTALGRLRQKQSILCDRISFQGDLNSC